MKKNIPLARLRLDKLKNMKRTISNIISQFKLFVDSIKDNFNIFNIYSKKLSNEIDNNITWLENYDYNSTEETNKKIQNFSEELKEVYNEYYEKISFIYNNIFIKKILTLNKDLKNLLDEMESFDPPRINSLDSSMNSVHINISETSEASFSGKLNDYERKKYSNFYESFEINSNSINNKKNESNLSESLSIKKNDNHKNRYLEEILLDLKEERNKFLNSIPIFLKGFIIRCNYILMKNEKLSSTKIIYDINKIQIYKYPFIRNENDFNHYKIFLNEINSIYSQNYNNNILLDNKFLISEINCSIIDSIKPIFNNKKIKLIDNGYNFYSESDSDESLIDAMHQVYKNKIIIASIRPGKSSLLNFFFSYSFKKSNKKNEIEKNNNKFDIMKKKSNIYTILNIMEKDYKNKNWNKKGNNPKSKNYLNNKIQKKKKKFFNNIFYN